jgi:hypothetical protein
MSNMTRDIITYAFKFDNGYDSVRVATRKARILESISGELIELPYEPRVIAFDPMMFEIGFESAPPIPSAAIQISDPQKKFQGFAQTTTTGQVLVSVYALVQDQPIYRFDAVISDVKWSDGVATADVRLPEDLLQQDFMRFFTASSFQYVKAVTPKSIRMSASFDRGPEIKWQIYHAAFRKAAVAENQNYNGHTAPTVGFGSPLDNPPSYDSLDPSAYQNGGQGVARVKLTHPYRNTVIETDFDFNLVNNQVYLYELPETDQTAEYLFQNYTSDHWNFLTNQKITANGVTHYYVDSVNEGRGPFNLIAEGSYTPAVGDVLLDLVETSGGPERLVQGITDYAFAQIGDPSLTENTEVIAYSVSGQGRFFYSLVPTPDNYCWEITTAHYLSAIPVTNAITALSNPLGILFDTTFYRMKRPHSIGESVAPCRISETQPNAPTDTVDALYVKANGFTPDPLDPEFGAGFMYLGQKMPLRTQILEDGTEITFIDPLFYKLFTRFKIDDYLEVVDALNVGDLSNPVFKGVFTPDPNDPGTPPLVQTIAVAKLSIQDRFFDYNQPYSFAGPPETSGSLPDYTIDDRTNTNLKPFDAISKFREHPVELLTFQWMVGQMDVFVDNLDEPTRQLLLASSSLRDQLKNRLRGLRLDMIKDYQQLAVDITKSSRGGDTSSASQENAAIINNATSRFAVIQSSEIVVQPADDYDRIIERLTFFVPGESSLTVLSDSPKYDSTTEADASSPYRISINKSQYKQFSNYMVYKPSFDSASDQESPELYTQRDYKRQEAERFFLQNRYRIIYDPVPENSSDLGRYFPICYGNLWRVPLMQVISKKTMMEDKTTAGDDLYIYASHPCAVRSPQDIVIEHFEDNSDGIKSDEQEFQRSRGGLYGKIAKNPFPNFEDGHVELFNGQPTFRGQIQTPYHQLEEAVALDNRTYYGIRLQGALWEPVAGVADKRYPVRNGFGTTPLYGSFAGYTDASGIITGEVGRMIEHPLDVVRHYFTHYGRYPYNLSILDLDSIALVKASTSFYRASILIDQPMKMEEFLEKICKQFCLFRSFKDGKITFHRLDTNRIDWIKKISDNYNLLGEPKEIEDGYRANYTEMIYRYALNRVNSALSKTIHKTSANNAQLARTSRMFQGKEPLTVDADWVLDQRTARDVSDRIVKIFCSTRRQYEVEVKRFGDDRDAQVGDRIPFTCEELGITELPCVVMGLRSQENERNELKLMALEIE